MAVKIPSTWMPDADIKRIHVHWTAGGHSANAVDKNAYHVLVQGDGSLVRGEPVISGNSLTNPTGKRSQHTRGANTGAIGISMCSMAGSSESPFNPGAAPLQKVQWDVMIQAVAQLARRYGVAVTPQSILTHAEVQPNLGFKQKNKWDITRLAFDDSISGFAPIGNRLRKEVAIALGKVPGGVEPGPLPADMKLSKFKVKGVAPEKLNFRRSPGGDVVGELPENTVVEQLGISGEWWQVRTPGGFVGWVNSAFLQAVGTA